MRRAFLILALLLSLGACSQSPEERKAALLGAAEQGDVPRIQSLLDEDTDVNSRDVCFFTPLMKAASAGNLAAVDLLLESGAQVDAADKGGYTALLLAASNDHRAVVERLLAAGADVNHQEQTQGWSALIWTANLGYADVVETLLAHGADPALRDMEGQNALDWARRNGHERIAALLTPVTPAPEATQ